MTEHISILQGYIDHLEFMKKNAYELFDREQADKDIEAFKAAIEALEQAPCEDAIKKTDIVELLRHGRTYALHHPEQYKTEREADIVDTLYVNLIQAVDKLPPVDPQPETGHWITYKAVNTGEILAHKCNLCKYEVYHQPKTNFCPNCGCRMVDPQESEG